MHSVDANQGYQFNEDDSIIFVEEYYDINTSSMQYKELGDSVSYDKAESLYRYSSVNYGDVNCYIGFDLYDVYNNDFYLKLRPGKPAYEIDAERGNSDYSTGGDYDEGTVDASTMVGFVVIYDSDSVLGDAEADWVAPDGYLKSDSIYYSGVDKISLVTTITESSDEELTYTYYYSSDSMFSQRELSTPIHSGTAKAVAEDGAYNYHFDYDGEIKPGYYIIAINDSTSGGRIMISACQVVQ